MVVGAATRSVWLFRAQGITPVSFTGKERAALRAEAHHLKTIVHIGKDGITRAVRQSLNDALRTKELVKIQVGKTGDMTARDAAPELAAQLSAEVIQVIGHTVTLYRHNPDIKRSEGDLPPWRR
jgi:RNA-binding protein